MGLDQYLEKKNYIGNEHRKPAQQIKVLMPKSQDKASFPVKGIKTKRIQYIIESVAYWRKANQIHKWFVDNIQEGNDDCKSYYVGGDQLQELLKLCKQIKAECKLINGKINNGYSFKKGKDGEMKKVNNTQKGKLLSREHAKLAHELLPTQSGFFYGSTDYDQYYINDIEYTIKQLTAIIKEDPNGDYYYQSSW